MLQSLFSRSMTIAAPLSVAALLGVACAKAGPRTAATVGPAHESTVTIAPGELYYVLPRRVCTSVNHVGDTVTAMVWRARQATHNGMVGISPDPAIPDSLQAVMRVVRVDVDSTDMSSPIQFAVMWLIHSMNMVPVAKALGSPYMCARWSSRWQRYSPNMSPVLGQMFP